MQFPYHIELISNLGLIKMARARRIDTNQNEIVQAFRDLKASVLILSSVGKGCPDILVGINGENYLVEIKDGLKFPSQIKLTKDELKFHNEWLGNVTIISSVDEAISFINIIRSLRRKI